jgi:hypothetical protein
MALLDSVEYIYSCPHCKGKIVVTMQYYYDGGSNHVVEHIDADNKDESLTLLETK